jgi:glycerophosphoryl diester phosphodiesterase
MIKIFAHRGYVQNNIKENSIASLKNAVKNNFKAIEFDIWLDDGELYLSHDKPPLASKNNLARFRDYLIYENKLYYWLDFKNLDENNVVEAMNIVKKDLNDNKIDLSKIYFAPYIIDYDLAEIVSHKIYKVFNQEVNLAIVCDNPLKLNRAIDLVDIGVFNFISINYKLINDDILKIINAKKLLVWTVNDNKIFNNLMLKGVDKFASDIIILN